VLPRSLFLSVHRILASLVGSFEYGYCESVVAGLAQSGRRAAFDAADKPGALVHCPDNLWLAVIQHFKSGSLPDAP
jgi:hypothetical protein